MPREKLSIVIPVFNEERTIVKVLDAVLNVSLISDIEKEIIIVNDCSTDDTLHLIDKYLVNNIDCPINIFSNAKNQGKGASLHLGLEKATGDYIIIQDADLEYDPKEYNLLLKPMVEGFADVVYGSRFIGGNPHRALFFWHTAGNKFLTFVSNVFTNLNLTDIETCYKLFRKEVIAQLKLKEKKFGFEPEVTAKISKIPNIRIYEVGISYYGRSFEEGKKIGWKDGFRALYAIMRYNIFR